MNEQNSTSRLGWLNNMLTIQRNNAAHIMSLIKGIGVRSGLNQVLHQKFTHLLEQVSHDREKELDLINEIEAIEQRHLDLKLRNKLRRANPEQMIIRESDAIGEAKEEKPKRKGLLTLFGLIYLFTSKPINNKNQDLTAD